MVKHILWLLNVLGMVSLSKFVSIHGMMIYNHKVIWFYWLI